MNEPIIQIRGIGKRYSITHARGRYVALRDVLTSIAKSPFRFFKQKAKEATGLAKSEEFWALKDVSLDIQQGDIVGIIGSNGAGKSTLLKILTGITPPTEGEIRMNGRVASLLEVGTGFHPELTGRENIFLNGAILGMTKKEIASKFDEIVAFAGIEKFLDTPVKRYSSGMYVRLAFSVAAHMDPDILLVDEVLAVGDAEFQKKCLGKMEEVTRTAGRTILFVSHNMEAIKKLCKKTLWLEHSTIKQYGDTQDVIERYLGSFTDNDLNGVPLAPDYSRDITFTKCEIVNEAGIATNTISVSDDLHICLEFIVKNPISTAEVSIGICNSNGLNVTFTSLSDFFGQKLLHLEKGTYKTRATIAKNILIADGYSIRIWAHERGVRNIEIHENILRFTITENGSPFAVYGKNYKSLGVILSNAVWTISKQ